MLPKGSGRAILAEPAPLPWVERVSDKASPIDGSNELVGRICFERLARTPIRDAWDRRYGSRRDLPLVLRLLAVQCWGWSCVVVLVRAYFVRRGVLVLAYSTQHYRT